jgi:O-antigen ligase
MAFLTKAGEVKTPTLRILFLVMLFRPIMDRIFPPIAALANVSMDSIILIIITAFLYLEIYNRRYSRNIDTNLKIVFILNLLVMVLASSNSFSYLTAGRMIFVQISFYSIYIITANIKLEYNVIKIFQAIVYSSIIPLLYSLYDLVTDRGYRYQYGNTHLRTSSIFEGAYVLGIYLAFVGIVAIFLAVYTRKQKYTVFSFLIALGIIASGSRASLVVLVIGALILLTEIRQARRVFSVISASIILVILIRFTLPETFERFSWVFTKDYYSETNEISTANVRLSWWYIVWPLIESKPFLGWGLTNQTAITFDYYGVRDVSSGFLVRLIEGGVFLVVTLILPILISSRNAFKQNRETTRNNKLVNRLIYAVCAMIILTMFVESILLHGVKGIYPWSTLGLAVSLGKVKLRNSYYGK